MNSSQIRTYYSFYKVKTLFGWPEVKEISFGNRMNTLLLHCAA